ncbi:MAG: MotA/TolQ/ExbB proton channel family protein, partial [Geminicoccaceae bacterium]|nr:MotA/TolQ/ExbB proton channel family protein [Geminicoccaceae bacterium]
MEPTIGSVGLDAAAGTSILALVWQADIVVKLVMLVLLLASLWCWAVIVDKSFRLLRLHRKVGAFEKAFWSGMPLEELYRQHVKRADHPMALMFAAAMEEWREAPRQASAEAASRLVGRIGQVMRLTMDREVGLLERGIPSLATIGSVAPFVGLFGTVWGI